MRHSEENMRGKFCGRFPEISRRGLLTAVLLLSILLLLVSCGPNGDENAQQETEEEAVLSETKTKIQRGAQETAESVRIAMQETYDMENPQAAAALTLASTACLTAPGTTERWTGTAVIWDQTEDEVVLLTSAHLLEKAEGTLLVSFAADQRASFSAECDVIGIAADVDLGFVSAAKEALDEELLGALRYVRLHQRTYDTIAAGDVCFATGCGSDGVADPGRQLIFSQFDFSEEDIGEDLFLFEGACESGMSGSGVFDGYGNFIGMVVATDESRTLAVPMADINAAYRELTGTARDTRDYGG